MKNFYYLIGNLFAATFFFIGLSFGAEGSFLLGVVAAIIIRFGLFNESKYQDLEYEFLKIVGRKNFIRENKTHDSNKSEISEESYINLPSENNRKIKDDLIVSDNITPETYYELDEKANIKDPSYKNNYTTVVSGDSSDTKDTIKPSYKSTPEYSAIIMSYIKKFFSENALAKIGGIFIALAVLFFMGVLYTNVGVFARIIIGFIAGFGVMGIGKFVHDKGYESQGSVLIGLGFIINYIVILLGRFSVFGNDNLSMTITFGLLLANTVFAGLVALLYKNDNLLFFSVFFAYIIPILAGISGIDNAGYDIIYILYFAAISSISIVVAHYKIKDYDEISSLIFLFGGFVLSTFVLTFFIASPSNLSQILKILVISGHGFAAGFLIYKHKALEPVLLSYFTVFFIALFFQIGLLHTFSFETSYLQAIFILGVFMVAQLCITKITINNERNYSNILYLSFALPLAFLAILDLFPINTLIVTNLVYMLFSSIILRLLIPAVKNKIFVYAWVVVIAIIAIKINISVFIQLGIALDDIDDLFIQNSNLLFYSVTLLSTAVYFGMTQLLSFKYKKYYFDSIGVIASIFMLMPTLNYSDIGNILLSFVPALLIWLVVFVKPLWLNTSDFTFKKYDITISNFVSVLYIVLNGVMLSKVYKTEFYFSFVLVVLAIAYFIGIYILLNKSKGTNKDFTEIIYSYLSALILIVLSIIFLQFGEVRELLILILYIVPLLLMYNTYQKPSIWLVGLGSVIFLLGLGLNIDYIDSINYSDILGIEYLLFILGLMFINVFSIKAASKFEESNLYYIFNIIAHILISISFIATISVLKEIDVAFMTLLYLIFNSYLYLAYKQEWIFKYMNYILIIPMIASLGALGSGKYYIFALIIIVLLFDISRRVTEKLYGIFLQILAVFYFFVVSSIFVFDITNQTIFISIYWGILALSIIHYALGKNQILRATGLVILLSTIGKILLIDIWMSTDMRIPALIIVGAILIYISILYTKNNLKINNDLKFLWNYILGRIEEFTVDNSSKIEATPKQNIMQQEKKEKPLINKLLENYDVSNIQEISLMYNDGREMIVENENLKKIIMLIYKNVNKTKFGPKELKKHYNDVVKNYHSNIDDEEKNRIYNSVKEFVLEGGEVKIEYK